MAVILWIGAAEVLALNMTIGQLIAFQMMVSHSSQPLGKLVQLWEIIFVHALRLIN